MKVTKLQAAGAQLDAAVGHFIAGEWVSAIHCAGAAEELCGRILQAHGGKTIPDSFWDDIDFTDLVSNKTEFIKNANLFRDWVKHTNNNHAEEIDIEEPHALFSVMRAVTAYGRLLAAGIAPKRESFDRFVEWHVANEDRLEQMVNDLPD